MVIAVDFDGTIVEHKYPAIGEEKPFACEVLRMLIAERHRLILWTVREGKLLDDAIQWCKKRGVEFWAVNSDSSDMFKEAKDRNLSCKLNADVFIDDRNIGGLPDWGTIYRMISRHKTWHDIIDEEVRSATLSDYEDLHQRHKKKPWWKF